MTSPRKNALTWPLASLLSGVSMLVVGIALLSVAIGAQAGFAKYSALVTGMIMSAYFAGFVYGTYACPVLIRRVGYIRAFAVMASVASALPVLHAVWTNPWFWGLLRFVTGLCIVGLYMVIESWLNVVADRESRGKVFAAYMAVSGVSMALGQWLILVGDRFGFVPFALVSVLFSFALIPTTMTTIREPRQTKAPSMNLLSLFVISPIGAIASMGSGLISGTFYSLGNVFGAGVGFSDNRTAAFMAVTILSGAAFQWPVGHVSDRYDRRWILFWICVISALLAAVGFYLAREYENFLILLGVLYGAMSFSIYGLSVAHTNDLIEPSKVLETTGGLLLLYGIGATIGPTLAGGLMDYIGAEGLMLYFALVLAALAGLVWYYTAQQLRTTSVPAHRSDYVMMDASSQAVLQMDPRNAGASEAEATERPVSP
jgi:MFS family permease